LKFSINKDQFSALLAELKQRGFSLIGPKVREDAILYENITGLQDLPQGWTDEQAPGLYRLKRRNDQALFGYVVGPHSWKKYLHVPWLKLWSAARAGKKVKLQEAQLPKEKLAFIGVRACELSAIAIQDKVFLGNSVTDPQYRVRRSNIFIVAVNCAQAGGNCFCVSMNTGPKAQSGFDISVTEIVNGNDSYFVAEAGSAQGADLLAALKPQEANHDQQAAADAAVNNAAQHIGKGMDTTGIKDLLFSQLEHPHWEDLAKRCLACTNCTMVCPTCFCTTVEDRSSLDGSNVERWRKWDSCFSLDFTYIHGGSVRRSTRARYRQWLTHKLAGWIEQFGTSGCVGCGRCITWCPVGIDITAEVAALRKNECKI
jgi:ferredoxin